uniref:Uncharacterized protein n=1 Tax=Setaria digitata TaxID=48799 RepID=A0A915Q608_9BILA
MNRNVRRLSQCLELLLTGQAIMHERGREVKERAISYATETEHSTTLTLPCRKTRSSGEWRYENMCPVGRGREYRTSKLTRLVARFSPLIEKWKNRGTRVINDTISVEGLCLMETIESVSMLSDCMTTLVIKKPEVFAGQDDRTTQYLFNGELLNKKDDSAGLERDSTLDRTQQIRRDGNR